ncbi:glycoside hydrolase family 2 protein [Butyrivibrio sp. MC2013]|uniref:glycoside hydrolase family 2 protein n=1 Tax=Butyrivibrio sp. MC2013 TaxID=1280686 RepID=UPI0004271BF1|nr:glycoside hydrolase family 2 [Butyrivibrio sp. MC2013]
MDLTGVSRSMIRTREYEALTALETPWTREAICDEPKKEYPRPLFVREDYHSLNGIWGFSISAKATIPKAFRSHIRVPFSPECRLAMVSDTAMEPRNVLPHTLTGDEFLWYRKEFTIPRRPAGRSRLLLHFGAVDQICDLWVNGRKKAHHEGGYLPFTVDISDCIEDITGDLAEEKAEILVRVIDVTDSSWMSRGKQTFKRGGMYYSPQSGIWQSVWLEWVHSAFLVKLETEPMEDLCHVKIRVFCNEPSALSIAHIPGEGHVKLFEKRLEKSAFKPCDPLKLQSSRHMPSSDTMPLDMDYAYKAEAVVKIDDARLWSPEDPYLYDFEVRLDSGDRVRSYMAVRYYSVQADPKGRPRFCLNHKPYFLKGILDQGYWPDGLMTAPSDKALLRDIKVVKELGFNMMRKHVKIEEARWYYHCDRLGMIVFQDMVSGGSRYDKPLVTYLPNLFPHIMRTMDDSALFYPLLSRADAAGREAFVAEMKNTVSYLKSYPSIGSWTIFNEGWGQFDAASLPKVLQQVDNTRPIDAASGWFDQHSGDFLSIHNYFRKPSAPVDRFGRATFISECGGLTWYAKGHSASRYPYGYKVIRSRKELNREYEDLIKKQLLPLRQKGLCGFVYTQVSDVEDEVNGIMTYDRKLLKIYRKIP